MKITQGKLGHMIVRDIKYQEEGGIHSFLKNVQKDTSNCFSFFCASVVYQTIFLFKRCSSQTSKMTHEIFPHLVTYPRVYNLKLSWDYDGKVILLISYIYGIVAFVIMFLYIKLFCCILEIVFPAGPEEVSFHVVYQVICQGRNASRS